MIPPGIDVQAIEPASPSDRGRPVILHAPSSRRRKGTEHVIAACEGLDADLVLVEGLHHDEAFERYREADIVVDQLNAGWYGLFAIECMALGKPVVTFLHDEAVARTEEELGTRVPIVRATKETLREQLEPLVASAAERQADRRGVTRVRRAGPRPRARRRPPARSLRSALMALARRQLKRLGKHSAIYGLGGLVSRILAVLLLPLYTRYLTPSDYGEGRDAHRAVDRHRRSSCAWASTARSSASTSTRRPGGAGVASSARRSGSRWRWRPPDWSSGLLLAAPISDALFGSSDDSELVMAAFVGLWARMNYEQITSLFRVEERSVAFVSASLANIFLTIGATLLLVVALDKGPIGVIVGNFTGTLIVYVVLLGYRREQLGLEFDRGLLREMNRFGIPLVPTALFLWVTNFSDRLFLVKLADTSEVGLYSVGVRIASAMVLLLTAFRLAWPAFAYSIDDDREAKRTYAFVLTYLVALTTWVATGARTPVTVDRRVDRRARVRGVVARRRPARVLDGRVRRLHRRRHRRRPRQADAVQLGRHGRSGGGEHRAEPRAHPAVRDDGRSDRDHRRVLDDVRRHGLVVAAHLPGAVPVAPRRHRHGDGTRTRRAREAGADGGLAVALALALVYPLALLPLGFYLPAERRAIGRRLRLAG